MLVFLQFCFAFILMIIFTMIIGCSIYFVLEYKQWNDNLQINEKNKINSSFIYWYINYYLIYFKFKWQWFIIMIQFVSIILSCFLLLIGWIITLFEDFWQNLKKG